MKNYEVLLRVYASIHEHDRAIVLGDNVTALDEPHAQKIKAEFMDKVENAAASGYVLDTPFRYKGIFINTGARIRSAIAKINSYKELDAAEGCNCECKSSYAPTGAVCVHDDEDEPE